MLKKIEEYLDDYNSQSKIQMKLILFLDACDHIARICRVLRQPQGNALLLGVGGSGRQSLSKLATFMSSYIIYQIEVIKGYSMKDWRENLKDVLLKAGVQAKQTSFLFVDTQIINENMLEDINTVLNSGDVPQLYKTEDLEPIFAVGKTECNRRGLTVNKMNMFQCYLNRVKANVHMIIAMSPLGEIFRSRLRQFPSLVNCCTIDWFTNWPAEALVNVARGSMTDPEAQMNLEADEEPCIEMFKIMHQSVEVKVEQFREQFRRISYVTPTSYLELLSTYKKILNSKREEVGKARNRLARGLDVLKEAAIEVDKLQKKLEADAPILAKTQIEVDATKKVIAEKTKEAEAVKSVVVVEEEEAARQAAEVKAVKDDADKQLSVALPALENAVKKVKEIDVNNFYELRGIAKPSPSAVACFKLVCFLMVKGEKPKKSKDPESTDAEGYFDLSKKFLLNDPKKFLRDMIDYDKDHIPDATIQKLKPLMEEEVMSEGRVKNASTALVAVRIWINAMIIYHETLKIVNPMRETARVMGEKLAVVMGALAEKQAQVKEINDNLDKLNANAAALEKQAKELEENLEKCNKMLVRAEKMIGGLEGEKNRWTDTVAKLTKQQGLLVGDCLVAAGMVSYAGPFTAVYRENLESMWRDSIQKLGISLTPKITMRQVIGNDVTIRGWAVAGLPSDNLSVENGIIMFGSRRWPLMIDPQT
jgi:dynein heavy chain, axonemal